MSYLKHLPISTIKIDRSFISEITNSDGDSAIVQGVISMAHHLGLNVVAEGVETNEQHQRLLAYRCDLFQGFGLAKPMPLAELERLIRTGSVYLYEQLTSRYGKHSHFSMVFVPA